MGPGNRLVPIVSPIVYTSLPASSISRDTAPGPAADWQPCRTRGPQSYTSSPCS